MGRRTSKYSEYASAFFNAQGLLVPSSLDPETAFFPTEGFVAPPRLFFDGMMTPAEDQEDTPWCAAYAASNFAECVLWRRLGYPPGIDPEPLYLHAKKVDGEPDLHGTRLECALDGLLATDVFPRETCAVRTFGGTRYGADGLLRAKFAIHRYGCCVAGFDITDEWFSPRRGRVLDPKRQSVGYHAVTLCGYDENGVLAVNSWGRDYARDGFVYIGNLAFAAQFVYGAVVTHCLDGLE